MNLVFVDMPASQNYRVIFFCLLFSFFGDLLEFKQWKQFMLKSLFKPIQDFQIMQAFQTNSRENTPKI